MKKKLAKEFIIELMKEVGYVNICIYILLVMCLTFMVGVQPFLISNLFQYANTNVGAVYLFLLLISFLSVSVLAFPKNYMLQKVRKHSKNIVFRDIIQKSYLEFANMNFGEIQNLATEISYSVRSLQYESISFLLNIVLMIFIYAVSLLKYDIYIGILYLTLYSIYFYLSIILSKNNATLIQTALNITSKTNSFFVDYFNNMEVIIATFSQYDEAKKYEVILKQEETTYFRLQKRIDTHQLILQIILSIMTILMIGLVMYKKSVDGNSYILVLVYSSIQINGFGKQFLSVLELLDRLNLALCKIKFGVFENIDIVTGDTNSSNLLISMKNVTFGYNDKIMFNSLKLDIESGKFILIRGRNGSGKSTLLKLIKGMIQPISGEVIYYLPVKEVGYISQKMTLFDRTLKENMIFPLEEVDPLLLLDLIEVLDLKSLILDVTELTEKYPGDFGEKLSGGEKQKILIARAIINQYNVLILDEIDSALDTNMHERLMLVLRKYYRNKTVIMVSHRQIEESWFDKVVDIDDLMN